MHGKSLKFLVLLLSVVKTSSTVDGTGTMAGVEDFGAEVVAGVVAVAEAAARLTILTGVTTLVGIVIAGALKMIIVGVGVVAAGVVTETDLIHVVLCLVISIRVRVRIANR